MSGCRYPKLSYSSSRVRGAEEDGEPEVLRDPHRGVRQSPGLCPGPFDIRDMSPFAAKYHFISLADREIWRGRGMAVWCS